MFLKGIIMGYKPISSSRGGKIYGIRVACYKGAPGKYVFLLTFGDDVSKRMGWQQGSHVEMSLGDGKQAGWLRLKTNELGHGLFRSGKGSLALNISLVRLADDQTHSRETVLHKIKSGALYVKLPEWVKA